MVPVLCLAPSPEQARALGRLAFSFGLQPSYPPEGAEELAATVQLILEAGGVVWALGPAPAPADIEDDRVVLFVWDEGEQRPVRTGLAETAG